MVLQQRILYDEAKWDRINDFRKTFKIKCLKFFNDLGRFTNTDFVKKFLFEYKVLEKGEYDSEDEPEEKISRLTLDERRIKPYVGCHIEN